MEIKNGLHPSFICFFHPWPLFLNCTSTLRSLTSEEWTLFNPPPPKHNIRTCLEKTIRKTVNFVRKEKRYCRRALFITDTSSHFWHQRSHIWYPLSEGKKEIIYYILNQFWWKYYGPHKSYHWMSVSYHIKSTWCCK